jgi:hypothetical protein
LDSGLGLLGVTSPESIIRGFKKCCVSNSMNGTEGDVLREEDSTDDSLSGDERLNCD